MTLPGRSCDVFEHSRIYNSSNKYLYIAKLCKNGKVVLGWDIVCTNAILKGTALCYELAEKERSDSDPSVDSVDRSRADCISVFC